MEKGKIEKSPGLVPKQPDLEFRTDEELLHSVWDKRSKGIPLDDGEIAFVERKEKGSRPDNDNPHKEH